MICHMCSEGRIPSCGTSQKPRDYIQRPVQAAQDSIDSIDSYTSILFCYLIYLKFRVDESNSADLKVAQQFNGIS